MNSMRRVILSLVFALTVALTFASATSAHPVSTHLVSTSQTHRLAQTHKGTPNASGGGCGAAVWNGLGDIRANACISYAYPYLQPDGYATFKRLAAHGNVQSCRFRLTVYENGTPYTRVDYNCSVAAAQNTQGHYGPLSIFVTGSSSWYSTVQVTLEYQDGFISSCFPPQSPTQNI